MSPPVPANDYLDSARWPYGHSIDGLIAATSPNELGHVRIESELYTNGT